MSGGLARQTANRLIADAGFPRGTRCAAESALAQATGRNQLPILLYAAGQQAELPRRKLLRRTGGLLLHYAAANLVDDLVDGDCDYVDPFELAPAIAYVLLNLGASVLLEDDRTGAVSMGLRDFAAAAAAGSTELATQRWSGDRYIEVGHAIAGLQFRGYFRALWAGTTLESEADQVGVAIGILAHVAEDIRSRAHRLMSLDAQSRNGVFTWSDAQITPLQAYNVGPLQFVVENYQRHRMEFD